MVKKRITSSDIFQRTVKLPVLPFNTETHSESQVPDKWNTKALHGIESQIKPKLLGHSTKQGTW
jgi:hypothetical protein